MHRFERAHRLLQVQDIPRDPRAPAAARRLLGGAAGVLGPKALADARLLLSEVVTNSVRHGRGDVVRIVVDGTREGRMRIEVIDDGDGFTPCARRGSAADAGGWGLHLVETLSAAWGVRQGSTHVWFELEREA